MPEVPTPVEPVDPGRQLWVATEEITMDRVRRYAQVSGDTNAIHLDAVAAAEAGLSAPVAHGLLILGIVVRHADDWVRGRGGRITGCDTRFVRPLYLVDHSVTLFVTAHLVGAGHIAATASVLADDGSTQRAILRPVRISYSDGRPDDARAYGHTRR
ncbi:MaoC family dehydratase [Streptomyces sp. SID6673]|nr:MaoC family dehydratase [Streptomyces sp. SID11726]NEB26078.1 MaoC family dehydratase [Streptomyces sp. SID6673]